MPFSPQDLVYGVMRDSPKTIRVFLEFRMACIGCPIAGFDTVEDACREYDIDVDTFLRALNTFD